MQVCQTQLHSSLYFARINIYLRLQTMQSQPKSQVSTPEKQQMASPHQSHIRTFADTQYFAAGTYKRAIYDAMVTIVPAHIIAKTLLAPLERWRIIAQTQMFYPKRPQKFKGFQDYLSRVQSEQGFLAHWRGNKANCILQVFQTVLQIGIYDNFKVSAQENALQYADSPFMKVLFQRIIDPLKISLLSLAILYPIDTARIRLTMNMYRNKKQALFKGIPSALSLIKLEEGSYFKVYKGYLLANVIAVAHLNLYQAVTNLVKSGSSPEKSGQLAMAGQVAASVLAVALLHPLDTLKKAVQLNNGSQPSLFKSVRDVYFYMKKNLSYKVLFNGLTVSIVRTILYSASLYVIMTQAQSFQAQSSA